MAATRKDFALSYAAACQRRMSEALHQDISPAEYRERLANEQTTLRAAFLEPHVTEALCETGEEALYNALHRN